jgi:hypothetical protein
MSISQQLASIWGYLPRVIGALAVLIVGYLAAVLLRRITYSLLSRTRLDERLDSLLRGGGDIDDEEMASPMPVSSYLATGVFLLALTGVAILVLQALGLTLLVEPINVFLTKIVGYLPNIIGPAVLLLVAWIAASGLRLLTSRGLEAIDIDRRFRNNVEPGTWPGDEESTEEEAEAPDRTSLAHTVGNVVYWFVFLLFLPAILEGLQLEGLLTPVAAMVDEFLAFVPNLVAAGLILAVGYFVARLLQRFTTGFLASVGADELGDRPGIDRVFAERSISSVLGTVVFALVLLPVAVAALNALDIAAVTEPASAMLDQILAVVPDLAAAGVVVLIAYAGGRLLASILETVLAGVGFDALPERLGLAYRSSDMERSPSEIVGWVAFAAIMVLGIMEGFRTLGLTTISSLMADFAIFGGKVLLGVAVFAVGLFLAQLAGRTIEQSGVRNARMVSNVARASIVVLASAMALREMGIADPIINLAFGLGFGAIALAVAISFGLGAREPAGELFREFVDAFRGSGDARGGSRGSRGGDGRSRPDESGDSSSGDGSQAPGSGGRHRPRGE